MVKLPVPVSFDCDQANINKDWEKHKVNYREAEEIFVNKPLKLFRDKTHSQIEERFTALGITRSERGLYISFTIRDLRIRVISARDQSKKERELYEKE